MSKTIRIGIIGDADEKSRAHIATDAAINHAADFLSVKATSRGN